MSIGPNSTRLDQNAIAYANGQIRGFDTIKKDGKLSAAESAKAYGGNTPQAKQAFARGDLNKDGFIDRYEQASYNLFVDSSSDPNKKNPFADGLVTQQERKKADQLFGSKDANADERLRFYRSQIGQNIPQSAQ